MRIQSRGPVAVPGAVPGSVPGERRVARRRVARGGRRAARARRRVPGGVPASRSKLGTWTSKRVKACSRMRALVDSSPRHISTSVSCSSTSSATARASAAFTACAAATNSGLRPASSPLETLAADESDGPTRDARDTSRRTARHSLVCAASILRTNVSARVAAGKRGRTSENVRRSARGAVARVSERHNGEMESRFNRRVRRVEPGRTRELHLIHLVIHGAPAVHGADALGARHPALHRRATPRGPSNARGNSFGTGRNGTRAAETKF